MVDQIMDVCNNLLDKGLEVQGPDTRAILRLHYPLVYDTFNDLWQR
jgi:hypothetical protein